MKKDFDSHGEEGIYVGGHNFVSRGYHNLKVLANRAGVRESGLEIRIDYARETNWTGARCRGWIYEPTLSWWERIFWSEEPIITLDCDDHKPRIIINRPEDPRAKPLAERLIDELEKIYEEI